MSVLNWTFENFTTPDTIFVAGSSAGSIASPFYAGLVAEQYSDARITQLGDGSGGYRALEGAALVNEAWGVASTWPDWEQYADATAENTVFESYYLATASRFPDITMATYNAANDSTQNLFLAVLGAGSMPCWNAFNSIMPTSPMGTAILPMANLLTAYPRPTLQSARRCKNIFYL